MSIQSEIEEMFAEFSGNEWGETMNKKMAALLCSEMKGGRNESGRYKSCNDLCLRFDDGKFFVTKNRVGIFYKKAGEIVTAYQLLKTGMYSGREVAKTVGLSKFTILKLLKVDQSLSCICGTLLKDHNGWCSYRFNKSPTRQAFLNSIRNKKVA